MLEGALQLGASEPSPFSNEPPVSTLPPLGDFQLLEEIARGGMGVVYRARQISLNRIVAVKLILIGQFADKSGIRRFQAEAAAAAKLRHPNIIAIHEIGEQSGQHYFSMEYVEGQNLADFMRQQPISIRQAAHLVKKIADAIHYAHQQGIIHRDLKPSNILIDPLLEPRITDFGLARDLQADSDLTLTGQVLGSPNYISPEQARGQSAGPSSDLYSLGAILYHLLTARPPFAAETLTDTLKQAAEHDPVAPRLLNPSIPRDLETICLKCLEKDPAHRYSSAAALSEELTRFLNDEPILAHPLSPPAKAWRWCRRKPALAGLAAALTLSLLLGFIGITLQWRRAEQRADEARRNAYAADMLRAQKEMEEGSIGLAQELLRRYLPTPDQRDLRGWEWRFLWNQCRSDELYSLEAHTVPVNVLCSPNGAVLASGGADGVILWDLEIRQPARRIPYAGSAALALLDKSLFVGGRNGEITLFDLHTSQSTVVVTNVPSSFRSLSVSPDGQYLAAYTSERLHLWSLNHYKQLQSFKLVGGVPNQPAGLAFSPDSSLLAYCRGGDGVIVLWDLEKAETAGTLEGHEDFVHALAFAPGGSTLASGSRDSTVRVWDFRSRKELRRLTEVTGFVLTLDFDSDGEFLAAAGNRQRIHLFETRTWRQIKTFEGHSDTIRSLTFGFNDKTLITGCRDGSIKLWQLSTDLQPSFHPLPEMLSSSALFQGGKGLHLIYTNGTCALWSADPLRELSTRPFPIASFTSSAMSPEGGLWVAKASDGFKVFNHTSGNLLTNLPMRPRLQQRKPLGRSCFEFSRDGLLLAALEDDATCSIWRIARPLDAPPSITPGTNFALYPKTVYALDFSSTARLLTVGYGGGVAEIWNPASGQRLAILTAENETFSVAQTALSREDTTAIIAYGSGKIRIWNIATKTVVAVLGGQLGSFLSVALSPDQRRIAACGGDGIVRIWDAETHAEVAAFNLRQPLHALDFSPDNQNLFVLANNRFGRARLFSFRAPEPAAF